MSAEGQADADGEPTGVPLPYAVTVEGSSGVVVGENNILHFTQYIYSSSDGTWTSRVAQRPVPGCPYRGLNAFEEQDSDLFFGRDDAIEQVTGRLSACARPGRQHAHGILVVSGPSGAGKSSLLRAGMLPRLRRDGLADVPGAESWPCLLFTPGGAPLSELAAQVADLAGISADEARQALWADPASFRVLARQAVLAQSGRGRQSGTGHWRLLLVVDQFEQLFTLCPSEEERRAFIAGLHSAASAADAEPSALVVIGVRADFETRCADEYPELAAAIQDRFLLTAMTERALELAITEPARQAGAHVEQELTGCLLREIHARQPAAIAARTGSTTRTSAGVLPLLSYALAETWRVHSGDTMTLQDYDRTGGIGAAVETAAQRAYGMLTRSQQDTARQVFLQLTATSADGTDSPIPAARADLDAGKDPRDVQAVLHAFAAERLLTLTTDGAEISHEALLTAWPLLRDTWLEQTRVDRVIRTRLRDSASEWAARSKDPSYLWSGTLLASAAATAGASGHLRPLATDERGFLDASQRASRRRTRLRRAGLAIVCALALVAAGVGAYSVREQQDAAQHAATVYSTQLAADAQALQETDPGLAAQLAIAAYRYAPTEQAATQMYDSLNTPLDTVIGTADNYVLNVVTEVNGPLAAAIGNGGALRVWNLSNPSSPVLDATIRSRKGAIALSREGQLLAGGCPDSGVCMWSLADPRHPVLAGRARTPFQRLDITSMAISPDGELLAAAVDDGVTLVWSIANPSHPHLVADLPNPTTRSGGTLAGVAFAPRGHLLAETILGGTTRLWSITPLARPILVTRIKGGYASITFDPAGSMLAAVGDANIGLWQIGDLRHPEQLKVSDISVSADLDMTAVAFSLDGKNLSFTGPDTYDTLSEVCTLRIPEELLQPGTADPVCTSTGFQSQTASYTNGGALLTGGPGGLVRLWRWPGYPVDGALDEGFAPYQISSDGRLMASDLAVLLHPAIDIWSLGGSAAPVLDATIPVPDISMLEFLSARVLLTADGNGGVQLWDLRDPSHPRRGASLGTAGTEHGGTIGAESANHLAGIESPDGQLHLWRVTSPTSAVQVGTIPGAPGQTGILVDGQTAFRLTRHNIQWWDISDPAHPVRRSISALPGTGSLDGAIAAGTFLVGTTTIQPGSETSDLVLFDVVQGRVRSSATLSTAAGTELDLSPDNRLLAVAGSGDNAVTLWDISSPGHPRRLSTVSAQSGLSDITFSPDSKVLAMSTEGTVQLWDIHNPEEPVSLGSITRLAGGDADNSSFASQAEAVQGLAFTGRNDNLAISTGTETFIVDSDPAVLAARMCGYVGVPIRPAQWEQYAPGIPYERPCP